MNAANAMVGAINLDNTTQHDRKIDLPPPIAVLLARLHCPKTGLFHGTAMSPKPSVEPMPYRQRRFLQGSFSTPAAGRLRGSMRLALVAAVVLAAAGCSKPPAAEEPIRAVKVLTVAVDRIESGVEFAGEVRPRIEARFGFRVAGKLVQRAVEPGQRVKAGQLLAQIDAQDYLLAADAAKAQVTAAATNRNLAAAEYKRFKDLKDQNFISEAELDRRDAAVKAADAQLEQAQAQLSAQRNQSAYTKLVSDVAGVVLAVDAEAGQVVAAGQPIVRVAKDGPRDIVFSVPEDKVALIANGSAVSVRSWSGGGNFKGSVREIGASADPVTRTFQIKVGLEEVAGQPAPALGATVYAVPQAFERKELQIIKLPTSALKQDGKTSAVWLLDRASMTIKSQPVVIATADGNDAVISSGLLPGMLVVSAGVHVLQQGQKVTLYKEPVASPAKPATAGPVGPAPK